MINIPVGIGSLLLSSQFVHDPPEFRAEVRQARKAGWLAVDYVGILLTALGLGCLEVVLDKGQEDDWFGSPFITRVLYGLDGVARVAGHLGVAA